MLIERLLARFFMDAEGGDGGKSVAGGAAGGGAAAGAGEAGGGAGAGAGAGGPGSVTGAGEGAGAAAGAGAARGGTLLETIGKEGGAAAGADGGAAAGAAAGAQAGEGLTAEQRALQSAEKDTRRPAHVPAKYWDAEKGEVRTEAAMKSLTNLETRMRDFGLPPKEAGEYKFEVPKPLKDAGVDVDPAMDKAFRENALALGLTQRQYEGVMGAYFSHMAAIADQTMDLSKTKAQADLLGYYKTEAVLTENVRHAYKAFSAYADEKDMALIDQIGNIPAVIRVLAKVGKEMGEDPGVSPDAILEAESLDTLMRGSPGKPDSPYWDAKDPRHKATVAKVQRHHEATEHAARRRRSA